jgi:hypothetical protein
MAATVRLRVAAEHKNARVTGRFYDVFMKAWCRLQDSNPPPHDYKSSALPDELSRQRPGLYVI